MSFTESLRQLVEENRNGLLGRHSTWERVELKSIASVLNGFAFPSSKFSKDQGMPLLRIRDILEPNTEAKYAGDFDQLYLVRPDDLLIGMDGDFNSGLWRGPEALLNQRVCKLTVDERFYSKKLLAYALPGYLKAINDATSSITVKHLSSRTVEEIPLPLPARTEQDRIVAEIEKQFTRLDDAVAALKRVQANLKRYRASVLKVACEGRLVPTEADLAQKEGRDYEPASELLKRILAERRARWEADQLQKMVAARKPPRDDEWKKSYKEPSLPDTSDMQLVPEGWVVASMDQLTTSITSGSRDWSPFYGRGSGVFIMAQNVRLGWLDLRSKQTVDPPSDDASRTRSAIFKDDLLVTIVGANTGDICRVPDDLSERYVCQSVALMRPVLPQIARYLELYMCSEENGQRQYRRYIYGAGRPHLRFDQLRMTPVLIAPIAEIPRILAEAAAKTSVLDAMETSIAAQIRHANVLRQAILERGFSGELVPQDPSDEPASAMLERIRAEGAAALVAKDGTQKGATKARSTAKQRCGRVEEVGESTPTSGKRARSRQRVSVGKR